MSIAALLDNAPGGQPGQEDRDDEVSQVLSDERPSSRFMGSYLWGYNSPNMGYNYCYPTYNPTDNYP